MVEFGAFALFMALLGVSIYQVISLRVRLTKTMSQLIQSKADNMILSQKLGEALAEKSLADNEGFVKFLTTSRDWAFEYIEAVQNKIKALQDAMESGKEAGIDSAYKELVNMIPEDGKDK